MLGAVCECREPRGRERVQDGQEEYPGCKCVERLEVHTRGKGVCGVFTYEIAETKVAQVTSYSRDHQHPLMCTLEEA